MGVGQGVNLFHDRPLAGGQVGLAAALVVAAVGDGAAATGVFAREPAAGQRGPADGGDVVALAKRQDFFLGAAVEDVERGLLDVEARHVELFGDEVRFGELPGGEGAAGQIEHLAAAHQVVQRAEGLVDRGVGIGAVDVVEVDAIGLEALEALFDLADDVPAVVARVVDVLAAAAVDLGAEHGVVALARGLQPVADDGFALAVVVDVGGVDEVAARGVVGVEDGVGSGGVGAAAEHHGAQADRVDLDSGAAEGAVGVVVHGVGGLQQGQRSEAPRRVVSGCPVRPRGPSGKRCWRRRG